MNTTRCTGSFALVTAFVTSLAAQDHLQWLPGDAASGPVGSIHTAVAWDPDGPGPSGEVVLCGGSFTMPSIGAANLAWFDPATATWQGFADSPDSRVEALAVAANGDLWIGGAFTHVGGFAASGLAIWSGTSWSSPGSISTAPGILGGIQPLPNGDVVVGGSFNSIQGLPITGLARWDGASWHGYPGFTYGVGRLALRPNGHLLIAGNVPTGLAEWDGTGWTTFPPGFVGGPIYGIAAFGNGDIVVAGGITVPGVTLHGIARWNGTNWNDLGTGFGGFPHAISLQPNGDLLAGAVSTLQSGPVDGVVRWDGSQWSSYAPGNANIAAMVQINGMLYAVGSSDWYPPGPAPAPAYAVKRWDGAAWQPVTDGFTSTVQGLLAMQGGDLLAFGTFRVGPGGDLARLALRHAGQWAPVSHPFTYQSVKCAVADEVGNAWLAFQDNSSGQTTLAKWNGATWAAPYSVSTNLLCLEVRNQTPIVGSDIYPGYGLAVAHWDGTNWVGYGQGVDGPVRAVHTLANGDLIAGGDFLYSGSTWLSRIGRWDGTTWQPLGPGLDGSVRALLELPNGDLIAAGDFVYDGWFGQQLGFVARWDGVAWQPFGGGLAGAPGASVRALQRLPNGDLVAVGDFALADGQPAKGVALWDGVAWHALDGGLDGRVLTVAQLPNGDLCFGGDFTHAGTSSHFAELRSDQPALATAFGAGCAGTAGPVMLTATALPWLGADYRARCAVVSPTAFGLEIAGVASTQLPLANVFPVAAANCDLLVSPDALALHLPVGGVIATSLAVPDLPTLLGAQIHQQVVVAELSPGLGLTHLASTNALTLTIGGF